MTPRQNIYDIYVWKLHFKQYYAKRRESRWKAEPSEEIPIRNMEVESIYPSYSGGTVNMAASAFHYS